MTNHVHMIVSRKGHIPLEHIMRDMKKFTSVEISQAIEKKLDYIHENPVKHGFTNSPECYDWSSAIDHAGGKGLVDIEMLF